LAELASDELSGADGIVDEATHVDEGVHLSVVPARGHVNSCGAQGGCVLFAFVTQR